jgi:hypothetical protein
MSAQVVDLVVVGPLAVLMPPHLVHLGKVTLVELAQPILMAVHGVTVPVVAVEPEVLVEVKQLILAPRMVLAVMA